MAATVSQGVPETDHDGVFSVLWAEVTGYVAAHRPPVLRDDREVDTQGLPAMNFGAVKGRTFERVLIFPTKPIAEYVATRVPGNLKDGSRARLYVAATRACHSVAFVADLPEPVAGIRSLTVADL
jgi:hypothetical protein